MMPKAKELFVIVAVVALFLCAAFFVREYETQLTGMMYLSGGMGMLTYIALSAIAVVAAPISTFPLLPVASALWGPLFAALLSVVGWTIGSVVAFVLAKTYGKKLARSFVNIERAQEIARAIAGERPFVSILVLRMLVPVDVLSYAVGLFVPIALWQFTLATFLGVLPFAIIFSFAASMPLLYQLAVLLLAALVAFVGFMRFRQYVRRNNA